MQPTRNGSVQDADDLAVELAATQRELAAVRQERDDYRVALYGLLKQQWNHALDPDSLKQRQLRERKA
jgi:hypothetical protein